MIKTNEQKTSNFWIGFSLGIAVATGSAFLLGTKRGRDTLKKILKFSENMEENLEKIIERVDKQGSKKNSASRPFHLEDIESILSKIKQVTNHS